MKNRLFCLTLSLLMVLSVLPGITAADAGTERRESFVDTIANAAGDNGIVRGVHNSIIIDTDPTDGYEGDYVVIYNPSVVASNSISTGNLTGLIETTVEPSVMPAPDRTQANTDMPIYKIDIDGALRTLRARLKDAKSFPHEIGVFLGYPLADVLGFIENCGKNCLACGCWKVYSDLCFALQTFQRYDKCKGGEAQIFDLARRPPATISKISDFVRLTALGEKS